MLQEIVVPDEIVYNAIISVCEKGKQPERALELLKTMKQQGVEPNLITYNTLISACEKGK